MSELGRVKVTVERSRWLRGEGSTESALLRTRDGKMCCLGFACITLGRTEDQIRGWISPTSGQYCVDGSLLAGSNTRLVVRNESGHWTEPDVVAEAMVINDNRDMPDDQRETTLTTLLSQIGIDLEFVP